MAGDSRTNESDDARASDAASAGAIASAGRQGRRAAHGVALVISVLFIGSSTVQIVRGVFGFAEGARPGDPCADGVARLSAQLEAPAARTDAHAAALALGPALAERRLGEASEAAKVARACAATGDGLDTWAAFERMRMARYQLSRDDDDSAGTRGLMHAPPLGDEATPLSVDLR